MAVYACGYPIYHEFTNPGEGNTITYSVQIGSVEYNDPVVYTGRLQPSGSDTVVKVDLSPIFRNYLEMLYEDNPFKILTSDVNTFYSGKSGLSKLINTFIIISANNTGGSNFVYTVAYDYNTDYQSELPNNRNTNIPISFDADPRQVLFMTGYKTSGEELFSYSFDNSALTTYSAGPNIDSMLGIYMQLSRFDLTDIKKVNLIQNYGYRRITWNITSPCKNAYCLYYVNKLGGLDSMLCTGKFVESWNPERTDVQLYGDRSNRLYWQQKRIYQEIRHQWQLNTVFIRPEYLNLIDNLIYSPKVFLHDLDSNTITPVLVTDSSYQAKNRMNGDKPFYTLTVMESQKQIRM